MSRYYGIVFLCWPSVCVPKRYSTRKDESALKFLGSHWACRGSVAQVTHKSIAAIIVTGLMRHNLNNLYIPNTAIYYS